MSGRLEFLCGCRSHASIMVDPDRALEAAAELHQATAEWQIVDDVIRLREWGTDTVHRLPTPSIRGVLVDTAKPLLRTRKDRGLPDPVRLERRESGWFVRDPARNEGFRIDGARRFDVRLEPGLELGIGDLTLVAESQRFINLRGFLARLLGWTSDKLAVVDLALRAVRMAASRRVPLVLMGLGDLTNVALAIHRHALGSERPFVVSDPRRRPGRGDVRLVENVETGMAAVERASGGSLCVRSHRLPSDFEDVRQALGDPAARVQLIVCVDPLRHGGPYYGARIVLPSIGGRAEEVPRIIAEYAEEAAAELAATVRLAQADCNWLLEHSSSSVSEIEKGTRRLVALRHHGDNIAVAAKALGMAPLSLAGWFRRHTLPGSTSTSSRTLLPSARRVRVRVDAVTQQT